MQLFRISYILFSIFLLAETSFGENRKLDIPVPINEDILGIRIPYYNEKGFLEMQLDARLARKTDEDHVALKDLKLSFFEENNNPMLIEMPQAVFDLPTNILSGDNGATIKRQDMDISARSIVLQTNDRLARFKGRIKMTILNFDLGNSHSPNSKSSPK